ncbi:Coactosin-like protein, partial [Nibea albiflora]
ALVEGAGWRVEGAGWVLSQHGCKGKTNQEESGSKRKCLYVRGCSVEVFALQLMVYRASVTHRQEHLEDNEQSAHDDTERGSLRRLSENDDARLFGFVRITTGDAMSKRAKFTLITWIGENISGLQRAKISTDKAMVKEIVQNFAKEFMFSDPRELDEDNIRMELKKAGGANYDAQAE